MKINPKAYVKIPAMKQEIMEYVERGELAPSRIHSVREAEDHFNRVQARYKHDDNLHLPSTYGVLINQDGSTTVLTTLFSYGKGPFGISPVVNNVKSLETSGVVYCGVTTATSDEGIKLMVHAPSPREHIQLLCQLLKLSISNGINPQSLAVHLYFNMDFCKQTFYKKYVIGKESYPVTTNHVCKILGIQKTKVMHIDEKLLITV